MPPLPATQSSSGRYIPAGAIPVRYGGLRREDDDQFSAPGDDGGVSELVVKPGSIENIEIPVPEVPPSIISCSS